MKYTQIPETAFKNIQMNAGILVTGFDPSTGTASGQLGATTGGISFTATPTFSDYGDDIDNCPKNTLELKKLDSWEVTMSGTFVTVNTATAKKLIAAADASGNKVTPRNDVLTTDFADLWWIGDYSDVNTGENAGYCAVHMLNALSTGGFQIQSTDKGKGNFAFEFTGHYSMSNQSRVPFEVYIKGSESPLDSSVSINKKTIAIVEEEEYTLTAETVPDDAVITWSVASSSVATITPSSDTRHTSCVVTGASVDSESDTIVTATITVDGIDFTDTCTVVVSPASEG